MKKLAFLLCLAIFMLCFLACEDETDTTESSQPVEESSEQEYSGTVYTTRVEHDDGTYAIHDYREDGTIAAEKLYEGIALKSESYYGRRGQIERQIDYNKNGTVYLEYRYTAKGKELIAKTYDKNGDCTGKNVNLYDSFDRLESVAVYNIDGQLNETDVYFYDVEGRHSKTESTTYDGDILRSVTTQFFDLANGAVLKEEAILYDVDGRFILHEVYEYRGDEIIIIEKYDENGNPLPIDPIEP